MTFQKQPHFVLIPFMAQGHLIPMVDIARLLAQRGVIITIFTTPENYKRIESVITRAAASGMQIRVIQVAFPAVEAGLPEGCECLDMVPSMADFGVNFLEATRLLQPSVEQWLEKLKPAPSCILSDMYHHWTNQTCEKFGIPRLIFHGYCCFSLLCIHNVSKFKVLDDIASESESFVVPDLPHRIEMIKSEVEWHVKSPHPGWNKNQDAVREADNGAYGVVVNTFEELEPDYVAQYRKARGQKVWCIGPVNLFNKEKLDISERGSNTSSSSSMDLNWLDSWDPNSVIYACLGSLTKLSAFQLIEIGLGLEQSSRPFIWVVKDAPEEFKKWLLDEQFEERIKQRGLLIQGWAPQVLILPHPSIGVFLTHCGWNSVIEGVCSGLPMITWPMFAEQHVNEKLVVDVLKIGVKAGCENTVEAGDLKTSIDRIMDGNVEGEMIRSRAKKLGNMARKALQQGGSSDLNITHLIQDVMDHQVQDN